MHEYPITQSIVNISVEEAEKNNAKKINEIRLKVGELTGLVPESLQLYFDIISAGTLAEGAELVIIRVPVKFTCKKCFTESEMKGGIHKCPNCQSQDLKITGGNEYMIESLEVE